MKKFHFLFCSVVIQLILITKVPLNSIFTIKWADFILTLPEFFTINFRPNFNFFDIGDSLK